eukprot:COSAG01_NODE_9524_length_2419_cov_4.632759_2_plen_84_part_00
MHGADYQFFVRPPAKQLEPEPEVRPPPPPPPTTAESSQGSDESGWESESSSDEDGCDDVRLPDLFAPDMAAFPQLSRCRLYGG